MRLGLFLALQAGRVQPQGDSVSVGGHSADSTSVDTLVVDPIIDPATLSLTGWWEPDFAASPWAGVASAGSSGGRDISEGSTPPTVGSAVNGHNPADFDGTDDVLVGAVGSMTAMIAVSAYSTAMVIKADTMDTSNFESGSPHADRLILGVHTSGTWGVGVGVTSGAVKTVFAFHYDGTDRIMATAPMSSGAYHRVQTWYDGTNIRISVDGVAGVTSPTAANVNSLGSIFRMGTNYIATNFFDGQVAEVIVANTNLGATNRAKLDAYFRDKYAL
jgi:hypothetical protein